MVHIGQTEEPMPVGRRTRANAAFRPPGYADRVALHRRLAANAFWYLSLAATTCLALELWQPVTGITVLVVLAYWVDGRLFRHGILADPQQGASPKSNMGGGSGGGTRRLRESAQTAGMRRRATIASLSTVRPSEHVLVMLGVLAACSTAALTVVASRNLWPLVEARRALTGADEDADAAARSLPLDQSVAALYDLAIENYREGNYDKALELFSEVVAIDGSSADAHYNMARIYQRRGRHPEAIEHLNAALKYGGVKADVLYCLGVSHLELQQKDQAMEYLAEARDLFPEDSPWRDKCRRLQDLAAEND